MNLPKAYNPKTVEDKIYRLWLKSGFFNPDKLPKCHKKPYTIVIPPPNITGELHMGHALNVTIQDILIRWKRMQGFKTLWLPGTDHAGIATQNVVEKELKKEGKTRFDLGPELFVKRVWKWKRKYGNIILNQFKKLGASCDWSRTRFTMDKDYSQAVKQAFLHYYKKGWIYRGERTVNWCSRCSTSLSDLEIEYQEEPTKLYYIKYGPITIATVRPETKLGDTAVAVNPKDPRYKKYIGKTINIQTVLGKAKMKVIGDSLVDMNFGTGAMKVTPAHDIHDFELGEKYGLDRKQVIGPDGRMTKLAKKYAGMTVNEARKQIVEDMKKIGILEISSALWPFATLGWPGKTKDLKIFYPTDVLSTARDIINLWVARMIFSGMEFMKKIPFKDVYIHATILTREGKRMSKSLGTGVDPINLIEEYGADATRFGIAYQIMGGQDIRFVKDNILMGKKFCNKIWNASRFILMNKPRRIYADLNADKTLMKNLTANDKRILKSLDKTTKSVNKDLENFRFGKVAHTLYDFFWHDFCDIYIEISKKQRAKNKEQKERTEKILLYVLLTSLKLLQPFIPFVTEEIYQKLPIKNKKECLMIEKWPK